MEDWTEGLGLGDGGVGGRVGQGGLWWFTDEGKGFGAERKVVEEGKKRKEGRFSSELLAGKDGGSGGSGGKTTAAGAVVTVNGVGGCGGLADVAVLLRVGSGCRRF
ncbi:uncharacterized protein G2W53_039773 [Senna tora]|uniref:Uncharacterized protein n=1 Tax=Senna tora TaxID=362788 RepID=A0A834SQ30_9FABA|nr:uncharacterized protein G2W53_039773 [Senna tora]